MGDGYGRGLLPWMNDDRQLGSSYAEQIAELKAEVERLREVIRVSLRIECTAECRAEALTPPAKEKP